MTAEELAILVAVIGASAGVFGFIGVVAGSRIAARATRDAADLADRVAKADRDEVRRLHFDDRMRQLAALILASEANHRLLVAQRRDTDGPLPNVEVDEVYRRSCYELELLARSPETITALRGVDYAQFVIYDYDYQLHGPETDVTRVGRLPDDQAEWLRLYDEHDKALGRLKDAVRAEIGLERLDVVDPPPIG